MALQLLARPKTREITYAVEKLRIHQILVSHPRIPQGEGERMGSTTMEGFRILYSATLEDLKIVAENKILNDVTVISSILIMIISYWYFMLYYVFNRTVGVY